MMKIKRDSSYLIGNKFAKGNKPNKTSFKKGSVSWNKGMKGIHLSPDSEFKCGHKSSRWRPEGTIRQRKHKNEPVRNWIKVGEPNIWIEYAKYIWILENGKIPNGLLIHHKDKNSLNDKIENLALVSRAQHINIHRSDLLKAKQKKKNLLQGQLF